MSLDGFGQSRFESCSVTVNENERMRTYVRRKFGLLSHCRF